MISVRKRQYPSGIDRIRCLKRYLRQLTFVIDVDDGDERLDLKRSSEIGLARADNTICMRFCYLLELDILCHIFYSLSLRVKE